MSDLFTPFPQASRKLEYIKKASTRKSKLSKLNSRRLNSLRERSPSIIHQRHRRVHKACERCRMRKTKCDLDSPCKRCTDGGFVCTDWSKKDTEFKQISRRYSEALENNQDALVATVQKLYTMVRNNESWKLGDPGTNERGQYIVHNIAYKLGCIRHSPETPYPISEGAEDVVELQAQPQAVQSDLNSDDSRRRKTSEDAVYSSVLEPTHRASGRGSNYLMPLGDHGQMPCSQQTQYAALEVHTSSHNDTFLKAVSLNHAYRAFFDEGPLDSASYPLDTSGPVPFSLSTDNQTEPPMFPNASPFSSWPARDDFLGPAHVLNITAHYRRQ